MKTVAMGLSYYGNCCVFSEAPGITATDKVEELQLEVLDALRLELKHNHPKDRLLFPRLLMLIPQLVQLTEEFRLNLKDHLFDESDNFANTHELLSEIFDLH
mgnify:FL=1